MLLLFIHVLPCDYWEVWRDVKDDFIRSNCSECYVCIFSHGATVPRRKSTAPEIMQFNSRFVVLNGSPQTHPNVYFGQCNTKCQLTPTCTSFNHNAKSMTCELITAAISGAVLDQSEGWDFYPVNRNPGGKVGQKTIVTASARLVTVVPAAAVIFLIKLFLWTMFLHY